MTTQNTEKNERKWGISEIDASIERQRIGMGMLTVQTDHHPMPVMTLPTQFLQHPTNSEIRHERIRAKIAKTLKYEFNNYLREKMISHMILSKQGVVAIIPFENCHHQWHYKVLAWRFKRPSLPDIDIHFDFIDLLQDSQGQLGSIDESLHYYRTQIKSLETQIKSFEHKITAYQQFKQRLMELGLLIESKIPTSKGDILL